MMFKKILGFMMAAIMTFSLAACGQTPAGSTPNASSESERSSNSAESQAPTASESEASSSVQSETPETADGSTLVVYFSWSGNTEEMASYIAGRVDGDLYEITPETPYPEDYNEAGDVAKAERDGNARPAISNLPDSIEQYDTILVGYPIWNADLPMPLHTFLEEYDFGGKTIIPFTTHGGSGFSGTIRTISELQPNAAVMEDGLSISRNSVPDAQRDVTEWIAGLGL